MEQTDKRGTLGVRPRLIIIAGPTGIGKSSLALSLAGEFGGEIISADSMQVYRYMDIGTAKPTPEERARVRHHLIDVIDPDEDFNAALFVQRAGEVIRDLDRAGRSIWLVGGTGLYIRALTAGLLEGPGTRDDFRKACRQAAREFGITHLHDRLREKDEAAAEKIHPNDLVRVVRALEVLELSGESIVARQREHRFGERPYDVLKIGLTDDRKGLYEKIDRRCDEMIEKGLIAEVEGLMARGYAGNLKPMQSLGYKHMVRFVEGLLSLEEAVAMMKRDTRNYAKRQMTWFRADAEMVWHRPDDLDGIRKGIGGFLSFGKVTGSL
jgi:tRNA dimethylallyltransferase